MPSPKHLPNNTRNTLLSFGTLPNFFQKPTRFGFQLPLGEQKEKLGLTPLEMPLRQTTSPTQVSTSTQELVKQWFLTIRYSGPIEATGTLKKSFLTPRTTLFTDHMLAIFTANEPVAFKAPKTSSHTEKKDPKGKKPGAKTGQRKKSTPSTMNNPLSKIEAKQCVSLSKEATKSQDGHSKR
ncbi:hypothetical protein Tco_0728914 [Tanacetum coccineum]|uniref:Uncharacterized protein n=1 Tax=Tanacetum coccineum TaxID=301880 RepID=A0ABQ4YMI7_9ASTR